MQDVFYLGVLSDTHGDVETTRRALELFANRNVERVLHCGDVGAPEILDVFRQIPTDFVLGNCDKIYRNELAQKIPEIGGRLFDRFGALDWRGKRIFWTHGNDENRVKDETFSEEWDLICRGHTHFFQLERYKKTIVLNPGGIQSRGDVPSCCVVSPDLQIERLKISALSFYTTDR